MTGGPARADPRLAALAGLAAMTRDARLATLRGAAQARAEATRARDAVPLAPELDEGGAAGLAFVAARARWLEQERARANARLAAAHAAELTAQAAARRAVGRAAVLERLATPARR